MEENSIRPDSAARGQRAWSAVLSSLALLASTGCQAPAATPDDAGSAPDATTDATTIDAALTSIRLTGAVEKGPFVTGSTVRVGVLDAMLFPDGTTYDTSTLDDLGTFQLVLPSPSPIQIEGDGFYYNEAVGGLSTARIVLRALYVPTTDAMQRAYVNMVTHLTHGRVRMLVQSGTAFDEAVSQAERELRAGLAITAPGFDPGRRGVELTVAGGDDDGNAYLFAVSAVLATTARLRTGPADANLQELLNNVTLDLGDGALVPATVAEIHAALADLDTARIERDFGARLTALGSSASVPDLDRVLDQDRDGFVNVDDVCPRTADPGQEDGDGDGIGDACDVCPTTSCPNGCLPATATTPDTCVESCSDLDLCASPDDLCLQVGVSQAGECARFSLCAAPCDPSDASTCDASESCALAKTSLDEREYGWRCVPATAGAGPGATCRGNVQGSGCAHGLACDAGNLYTLDFGASCTAAPLGICRAACGGAAPACGGGEACVPRSEAEGMATDFPNVCETPPIPLPDGASCIIDRTPCETGLYCAPELGGVCTARSDVGGPCMSEPACLDGLTCSAGVCAPT